MKLRSVSMALLGLTLLVFIYPTPVSAERGTPESLEFAYGARLDLRGPYPEQAVRLAAKLKLDWIAVDYDWAAEAPERTGLQVSTRVEMILRLADKLGLSVLVSVKNPPAWALTAQGPDPAASADLVSGLVERFPHLRAIELYPQANTHLGWGVTPNPAAYAEVFRAVETRLITEQRQVYLVAGGLSNQLSAPEDLTDLDFLEGLYRAGLYPAILSLQLSGLTGDPLAEPTALSVRHYEQVRSVMTANHHATGLLWITGLVPPVSLTTLEAQSAWLGQTTLQLRSQLYLGTVFYQPLNPCPGAGAETFSLVTPTGNLHPFVQVLSAIMNRGQVSELPAPETITQKIESSSNR